MALGHKKPDKVATFEGIMDCDGASCEINSQSPLGKSIKKADD